MRWILTYSRAGQAVPLALDAQGMLYTHDDAQNAIAIAPARACLARKASKPACAIVVLPPPYGEVQTTDIETIDAWFAHLDLSGERNRKQAPAWAWAWGILGSIVLAILLTFTVGIPWLAGIVAQQIPVEWEKGLAEGTLESLSGEGLTESKVSVAEQERYQKLFKEVSSRSEYALPIRLEFRDWDAPNAFAIPGGVVVVTDPMLKLMKGDDEFQAVMAHEVAHLEHRHGVRGILQQSGSYVVISLLLGDASSLAILTNAMPAFLVNSAYSRDFEREADESAFIMLKTMGKSPAAFANVMRELHKLSDGDHAPKYLSTHPPTQERIDAAEDAAR